MTAALSVRLLPVEAPELVAVIEYDDGSDVKVRHQPTRPTPLRCSRCGTQSDPTCEHAVAAQLTQHAHATLTQEGTPV